ncbi:AraC family transcriptional regulator [Bradyrhizobium sp. BR 10289]|uniref:helix-turn-helix transcriptional regulator n=1 Tax=Bradyrhizobium sp. BR 10289 TaxID=2749993 RepID=UPI001C64E114|nr:AraC family transcriptional regulator [Bradyrhizobium sp. BR 10289]
MSGKAEFSIFNVSTDLIPEDERVPLLREFYCRGVLKAEVEARDGRPAAASFTSHVLPEAQLLIGGLCGARVIRTKQLVSDGDDSLALILNRSGVLGISARGHDLKLQAGQAVLTSAEDVTIFERLSLGSGFSLRVPRRVLAPMIVDVDDAVMRVIPESATGLRLLADYAIALIHEKALEAPAMRQLGVAHLHDLLALVLGATDHPREAIGRRGIKAARLQKAKFLIVNNCWQQDISVTTVAQELGVTPRYLQRLFEADGKTFSSFLTEQRLKRAHRMLREPDFAERPVSSIAYDVGFGDLSYFNRCFRRAYGATPTDVRSGGAL